MKYLPLLFALGAVLCWGAYVPTLHHGQLGFGRNSALRAFLFVGVAYFLVAVIVPGVLLLAKLEPAEFVARGVRFSTVAGVLGAAGALCVILALKTGGRPIFVAPLVFAGAPIVNTLVTMVWDKPTRAAGGWFYVGIVLAAVGAALVLRFKPS